MTNLNDTAKMKAATTYNAAADSYDAGFWDRYGHDTVARPNLRSGARVLDVACGSGAAALPAAEAVGSDGRIIAVDLAENMLRLGRAKASARAGDITCGRAMRSGGAHTTRPNMPVKLTAATPPSRAKPTRASVMSQLRNRTEIASGRPARKRTDYGQVVHTCEGAM